MYKIIIIVPPIKILIIYKMYLTIKNTHTFCSFCSKMNLNVKTITIRNVNFVIYYTIIICSEG